MESFLLTSHLIKPLLSIWQDTTDEALAEFFGLFKGTETVQRRVFRDRHEEYQDNGRNGWKFSSSVFVVFEDQETAQDFLNIQDLNYLGDSLTCKWQKDFYLEKGKFKKEIERATN